VQFNSKNKGMPHTMAEELDAKVAQLLISLNYQKLKKETALKLS
jgi:hypothetical protein